MTRQLLMRAPGEVELAEVEPQPLGRGDVRVAIAYAGICGSDLHLLHEPHRFGLDAGDAGGFGHEHSGVVSEVGADVRELAVGQPVACVPKLPCLACHACRLGRITNCEGLLASTRGSWADELVLDARAAFPLPDGVSLRAAALCEPLSCALRGVDRAQAPPGHVALVIGGGPIGLMTVALARHAGAREVLVAEPRVERRRLAQELGATAIDPAADDLAEAVLAATDGHGVEVAYEAAGRPASLTDAVELAAHGGTVVVLGVVPPDASAAIRPWRLFERELTIVGAWGQQTTFQRALDWLPQLDLERIVTHELPLDRAADALAIAAAGECGKVMLVPA